MTNIDSINLEDYAVNKKRHSAYPKTVEIMNELRAHMKRHLKEDSSSDKSKGLTGKIRNRRPAESEETWKYRKEIFVPMTRKTLSKVITSLGKIRKSQDWAIKYDLTDLPKTVAESENLQSYCEKNFPYFESFEEWVFNVLLKTYLLDANAVCMVLPVDTVIEQGTYLQPFPILFYSDQVYDFVQQDYAVLKSTDKRQYKIGSINKEGDVYYIVTTERIQRWEQYNTKGQYECVLDYTHRLGVLPVFKLGGQFGEAMDKIFIYESRLSPMVPSLDEAAREYSDMQAEVVQHIHSEKWEYATDNCTQCNGTGQISVKGDSFGQCTSCKGTGKAVTATPYGGRVIRPANLSMESPIPTPPAGYIQKDMGIVTVQDSRIRSHLRDALSAINMEFLADTPLNQSGVAKEVDRDELNNFVHAIASDIVSIMRKCYGFITEYRYNVIVPAEEERDKLLPIINVPDHFDILTSNYLADELGKAKTSGMPNTVISYLSLDFIQKKFADNPEILSELALSLKLDPFIGLTDDEKMTRIQNEGISRVDYVISCNILNFVKKAIDESAANAESDKKATYQELDFNDQYKILIGYANAMIKELDKAKAAKVVPIFNNPMDPNNAGGGQGGGGNPGDPNVM